MLAKTVLMRETRKDSQNTMVKTDLINTEDLKHIDLEARIQIARKVGKLLSNASRSSDHETALELTRLLIEDVSVSVRESLSRELVACSFLPGDIVSQVARDITQISTPFLMASEAIDDDFLEGLVRECGEAQQEAVARRDGVSEAVCFAICDTGGQMAVSTLLDNETATVSERSAVRVIDRFPVEVSLMEKLAGRSDLPVEVVERIIFKVSSRYGEYLSHKFNLADDYSQYLTSLATRDVFAQTLEVAPRWELMNYLNQLNKASGITSDLLLNYLQGKKLRTFIAAVSVVTDLPYEAVREKIGVMNKTALSRMLEIGGFQQSVLGVLLIAYERLFRG